MDRGKNKVDKQLKLISLMPKMYLITSVRKNIRRCLVVKQVTLYYLELEENNKIIVVRFYDNRRNSDSLIKELNESKL